MVASTDNVRIAAFVAGGPIALEALEALGRHHVVVGVITPRKTAGLRGRLRATAAAVLRKVRAKPEHPVHRWCRERDVPRLALRGGDDRDAVAFLRSLAPDVGCIATFPTKIGKHLTDAAGDTCLNLHPSLLPRHRGVSPLFWTYHAGDETGGTSVHVAVERFDAGPLLAQAPIPIARGEPVGGHHLRCARVGGALLAETIARWAAGDARPEPQDESKATRALKVRAGNRYAKLDEWTSAHAWHFLKGLIPHYREPFVDGSGRRVRYDRVEGFEVRDPMHEPGTVVREGQGWDAWARDGVVRLADTIDR